MTSSLKKEITFSLSVSLRANAGTQLIFIGLWQILFLAGFYWRKEILLVLVLWKLLPALLGTFGNPEMTESSMLCLLLWQDGRLGFKMTSPSQIQGEDSFSTTSC
jgi:hypothetical protein